MAPSRIQALRPFAAACALWLAAACGFTDAGQGTGTLAVTGELNCAFATMKTDVAFSIAGTDAALTNANITLLDEDTHDALHVAYTGTPGQYAATWPGYHRRISMQIWSEADGLMARLEGPGRHTVAHPRSGAVLPLKDAVDVLWSTDDGVRAQNVALTVADAQGGTQALLAHDGGQHQLPSAALHEGRATITVSRSAQVELLGGARTSVVRMSYSVNTDIVRQ